MSQLFFCQVVFSPKQQAATHMQALVDNFFNNFYLIMKGYPGCKKFNFNAKYLYSYQTTSESILLLLLNYLFYSNSAV